MGHDNAISYIQSSLDLSRVFKNRQSNRNVNVHAKRESYTISRSKERFLKKDVLTLHRRYFMYFIKFKNLLLNIKISNRVSSRLLSGFRSEYIVSFH